MQLARAKKTSGARVLDSEGAWGLFKQVHFLKGIPKDPFAAAFCRCNVVAFWGFALSLQLLVRISTSNDIFFRRDTFCQQISVRTFLRKDRFKWRT